MISYSSCFPTIIHCCVLLYPLSFADFILLFSSTVLPLFLQGPFFVGLHIILQITSRWPCWCFRTKKAKKEPRCWFPRLILRELNSMFIQRVCFGLVLRQMTPVSKIANKVLYSLCFTRHFIVPFCCIPFVFQAPCSCSVLFFYLCSNKISRC